MFELIAIICALFALWIFVYNIRRIFRYYLGGFRVVRINRDDIRYDERQADGMKSMLLEGEMQVGKRHVIFVPSVEKWDKMTDYWARNRRVEILARIEQWLPLGKYEFKEI